MKHTTISLVLGVLNLVAFITVATLFTITLPQTVHAVAEEKVLWCHCEASGGRQTLDLPLSALENAGHVDAGGQPLHAGDHAGSCTPEEVTDVCSNIGDIQETVPDGYYESGGECFAKTPVCADDSYENFGGEDGVFNQETEIADNELCSNDPVDVCPNLDGDQASLPDGYHFETIDNVRTCVVDEPTSTPTPGDPGNPGGPGDGLSDGRSDGGSSCPSCTAPQSGNVLGVSDRRTSTGSFHRYTRGDGITEVNYHECYRSNLSSCHLPARACARAGQ